MPLSRKIVTICFLSLGFIVIAIGIARLLWLIKAIDGNTKSYSVESAYSAIESSIAIIGTSGPTVKYLLSLLIPSLRPSFERSSANKSSQRAYGNHSDVATKRSRSQYGAQSGYDDLDSMSAHHQEFEMKTGWQKKDWDDDSRSDEQQMTNEGHGISKTVEWTVHTSENSRTDKNLPNDPSVADGKPAASPAHII